MANGVTIDTKIAKELVTSIRELKEEVSSLKKVISVKVLSENGFVPEFEKHIIASSKEPKGKSFSWNGKGSFATSVLERK
ncbi:MAG: hypothetical protein UT08_C0031G0007 [Candidatus Woesebacteria bacterium GW2011_GWB1_38_8]|uniref:Uncharacterized protein n=1 Tax=Candidatus Woesebacteria bacterium GW2011_GWB1_38_8 TaxID=1618570 RepID=A0A0G0P3B3_9BACT|nr:MAG: hypothetical protein UT08_C0031G0007 [Candidatus Woesebacteria bacterium GW2011_GWB1_38_8]